ncbi:MAG: pilus assembly protein [Candidatus Riflebacteria bacterium]|nr:pilus assembly protein [Candidatus Riflebacteria bacterium]
MLHKGSSGRSSGNRRGQTLVEMAMILPIIVLLLCAVLHFGILFYMQIGLEMAAREAALFASYRPLDDNAIRLAALNALPILVDRSTVEYSTVFTPTRSHGDPLSIQFVYNIQVLKALPFGALLPVPTQVGVQITVPIVTARK